MKFERRCDTTVDNETESSHQNEKTKGKSKREGSVLVYMVVMFVVALGLIALSYMIQQRNTNDTISSLTEQHGEIQSKALQNIEALQNTNLELRDQLTTMSEELEEAQNEIEAKDDELDSLKAEQAALQTEVTALEEQLAEQEKRTEALAALMALQNEGPTNERLSEMARLAQYLDSEHMEIYQQLLESY